MKNNSVRCYPMLQEPSKMNSEFAKSPYFHVLLFLQFCERLEQPCGLPLFILTRWLPMKSIDLLTFFFSNMFEKPWINIVIK